MKRRGIAYDFGLLGDVLMEQGSLSEAADAYQQMMDRKPGPEAYARGAHLRWLRGDRKGAVALMEDAVRAMGTRNPTTKSWALATLGRFYFELGELADASALAERALRLRPEDADGRALEARIALAEGDYQNAIDALRSAVDSEPLPLHRWLLIDALRVGNQLEEARAMARSLVSRHAEAIDPRGLSLFLATYGIEPARAVALAQAELEVRRDVYTLDAMGWALHIAGRSDEARSFVEQSLAAGTQDPRLHLHAGLVSEALEPSSGEAMLARANDFRHALFPSEVALLDEALGHPRLMPSPHLITTEEAGRSQ